MVSAFRLRSSTFPSVTGVCGLTCVTQLSNCFKVSDNPTAWTISELASVDSLSPCTVWGCHILTVLLCRLGLLQSSGECCSVSAAQRPVRPDHQPRLPSVASGSHVSSAVKGFLFCIGSVLCMCNLEASPGLAPFRPECRSSPQLSLSRTPARPRTQLLSQSSSCQKDRSIRVWGWCCCVVLRQRMPGAKGKGETNGSPSPMWVTAAGLDSPPQSTCWGSLSGALRGLLFFSFFPLELQL